jgi:hypothetical protein
VRREAGVIRVTVRYPPPRPPVQARLTRELVAAMQQETLEIANDARDRAPAKTGALRRSITALQVRVAGSRIIGGVSAGAPGAPYAKAVEFGTGVFSEAPDSPRQPIVIVPVRARALAWPRPSLGPPGGPNLRLSGAIRTHIRRKLLAGALRPEQVFVFAKRVVQQGRPPRPYIRPAVEARRDSLLAAAKAAVRRAFGGS